MITEAQILEIYGPDILKSGIEVFENKKRHCTMQELEEMCFNLKVEELDRQTKL